MKFPTNHHKFQLTYHLIEHELQTTDSVQAHEVFAYWKHFPSRVAIDPAVISPCINQ